MPTKKNPETTSPRVASIAGKLLGNPRTPAKVRTVAAAALTNAADKPARRAPAKKRS